MSAGRAQAALAAADRAEVDARLHATNASNLARKATKVRTRMAELRMELLVIERDIADQRKLADTYRARAAFARKQAEEMSA